MDDVKLAGNEPRCEIASRLDPLGPFLEGLFSSAKCGDVCVGNPRVFSAVPVPIPAPSRFFWSKRAPDHPSIE